MFQKYINNESEHNVKLYTGDTDTNHLRVVKLRGVNTRTIGVVLARVSLPHLNCQGYQVISLMEEGLAKRWDFVPWLTLESEARQNHESMKYKDQISWDYNSVSTAWTVIKTFVATDFWLLNAKYLPAMSWYLTVIPDLSTYKEYLLRTQGHLKFRHQTRFWEMFKMLLHHDLLMIFSTNLILSDIAGGSLDLTIY